MCMCMQASSPMTNQAFEQPVKIIPNHALRSLINSFVDTNGGWDRFV